MSTSQEVAHDLSKATIDATVAPFWWMQTPSNESITIVVKEKLPAPPDGAEITFCAYNLQAGQTLYLVRESGVALAIFTGEAFGSATARVVGGVWRLKASSGVAVAGLA
jgi:hypothetical protein